VETRVLQERIIYGPIDSRRLGKSLGVNILPTRHKVCSFDCLYCQYGFTSNQRERWHVNPQELPTPGQVSEALMDSLTQHDNLDVITLAGNGEPTLHPSFRKICEVVIRLRNMYRKGVPVCILSNSSTVDIPDVRAGLKMIDRPVMKLDAGTQEVFEKLNRPRLGQRLEKILNGLIQLDRPEIQALFVTGPVDNTTDEEVGCWLGHLERIQPSAVQVYTFERVPADSQLLPAGNGQLEMIADRVRERILTADVSLFLPKKK
jgi:wyosine [tRNA(Phe)-imidazoG37] synthetase (radical SAM superfamily)